MSVTDSINPCEAQPVGQKFHWRFWGGARELAPQTQRLIETLRWRCEHLGAWVTLFIAVFYGVLFILMPNPQGHAREAGWLMAFAEAPVPWALTILLLAAIVNLLRLRLCLRGSVYTYSMIVIECVVFYGLIWSFHWQYEQSPGFYLKTPAFTYAFVLIALRALLLRVRYVVFAGGMAVGGWIGLLWYAIEHGSITQSYVTYMHSNTILLRAEVHKMVSLILVTLVLSLAVAIARLLLRKAVSSQVTVRMLSQFVPERVAEEIELDGQLSALELGVEREATILFTDIAGFTKYGEQRTPTELMQLLNDYFQQIAAPIERHGGVICQFQGDAILACFNLPLEQPDHARRALLAARDILDAQAQGLVALDTRIGINTGLAIGGLVGTPQRKSYTLHGDHVNLAARLEQLNKEYGTRLLLAESTRQQAGDCGLDFIKVDTQVVRGRQGATDLYTLACP